MKKSIISTAVVSALAAASFGAAAQTSVTLYGIVDAAITNVSGVRTATGDQGRVTAVSSGVLDGSRWGIRGTEDLGGGVRALFLLESRFEIDNGNTSNRPVSGTQVPERFFSVGGSGSLPAPNATAALNVNCGGRTTDGSVIGARLLPGGPVAAQVAAAQVACGVYGQAYPALATASYGVNIPGRLFDRQAFMGLVTPVGAFLMGRQYTPAFETFATFDVTGTSSPIGPGQLATLPALLEIRESNTISYRIELGGIKAQAMYGLGETVGSDKASRLWGINASYTTSDFGVGAGHNERTNELGQKSLKTTVLGAYGVFGPFKLTAVAGQFKDDAPNGIAAFRTQVRSGVIGTINTTPALAALVPFAATVGDNAANAAYDAFKQDGVVYGVGGEYKTGPHKIWVTYNKYNDKRPADADVESAGVAYIYALSPRTSLYTTFVQFMNGRTAQALPGGNGFLGGVAFAPNTDNRGMAFGIQHRF
ncbi:MAG TPA: porin [Burkholderiaceae bacterium]|nr:porin [Burkholderiaceae bacterium]